MKLRPLLMKYSLVWATLQGFKTETRRLTNRYKMEAGDRFWIREPCAFLENSIKKIYKADHLNQLTYTESYLEDRKWKSPIIMPKAAARLMLNLSVVRQERLGDITEAGAITEGVGAFRTPEMEKVDAWPLWNPPHDGILCDNPICSFVSLWNTIEKNDWDRDQDKIVWVYRWETFEVIK